MRESAGRDPARGASDGDRLFDHRIEFHGAVHQQQPVLLAGVYPGYGYFGRSPLPWYDPIRYARYYSGSGFYNYTPPPIENPEVIVPRQSATSLPGITGLVVGMNEAGTSLTLRLPMKTVSVT